MKYSKLLSLLAASTIVASLFAGCQKAEQPVEEPKVEQKEEKTRTIGKESKNSIELVNELDVDIESICISYGEDGEVSENLLLDEPIKADETVTLFYEGGSGDVNITFIPKGDENQYTVTLEKTEEIKAPVVIKKSDDNKIIVTVEDPETKEEKVIEPEQSPVEKVEEEKTEEKKEEKKEDKPSKKEEKKQESKPSSNAGSTSKNENTPSSNNSSASSGTGNNSPAPAPAPQETHVHSYNIPITKTVHHDAVTHTEQKLVSAAWDEPVYSDYVYVRCNGCGSLFGSMGEWNAHADDQLLNYNNGACGSYSTIHQQTQTDTVHHDAVYEPVTVTDSPAYDETVTTGYKCSCGAVK